MNLPQTMLAQCDAQAFLHSAGLGRRILHLKPGEAIFCQGEAAKSVFYIQTGRAKLTVTSTGGKEATIFLLSAGDFVGEEAITPIAGMRLATATAITASSVLKIDRDEMIRAVHEGHTFSEMLLTFLLIRNMRVQADLVDHLFNSSEKRLARTLLLMADITESDGSVTLIPAITQETLAEIVGTTRSRINFFMNRFRKLGFIDYNRRIRVHKSLLNVVLHQ